MARRVAVGAVCFDFYGTLVTEPAEDLAWAADALSSLGYHVPASVHHWIEPTQHAHDGGQLARLRPAGPWPASRDAFVDVQRAMRAEVLRGWGIEGPDVENLVALAEARSTHQRLRRVRGIAGALDALRASGIAVGVCSNWDWDLDAAMRRTELDERVDGVVCSARAGVAKPDPRIFHLLLDELGIQPDRAAYVGDDWEKDVIGALGVGFGRTFYVRPPTPSGAEISAGVEAVASSTAAARAVLRDVAGARPVEEG